MMVFGCGDDGCALNKAAENDKLWQELGHDGASAQKSRRNIDERKITLKFHESVRRLVNGGAENAPFKLRWD